MPDTDDIVERAEAHIEALLFGIPDGTTKDLVRAGDGADERVALLVQLTEEVKYQRRKKSTMADLHRAHAEWSRAEIERLRHELKLIRDAAHVPFGPLAVPEYIADTEYIGKAARRIADLKPFGSNLTATVVSILDHVASLTFRWDSEFKKKTYE